jgi:recombination protein RecA
MQLGEDSLSDIQGISTGALSLDIALGGKGLPRGRVVEIYGPEASGKTTVALHAVAEVQKAGGVAAFIDAEHALDPSWAKRIGVDLEALLVSQPESAEQALKIAEMLVKSNAVDIIVIDSVAALVPEAEVKGEIGDVQPGAQARLMSQALRILTPTISRTRTCMVFINQIRQKIGVMFGNPETTSGGLALKFYASVRLDVRKITSIKEPGNEDTVGSRVRIKVVKNKVAPPFRQAEVDLMHDRGICKEADLLDLAVEDGVVAKSGGWHSYGELRMGNSRDKAKEWLRENPKMLEEISRKVLEKRGLLGNRGSASENGKLTDETPEKVDREEKPEEVETPTRGSRRSKAAASE